MMESKREDARIQRTYSLLLGALTELLEEKPFEEIRITDLCERAGVHRSTFYAHFEDKHHLLTFAIQELMDIFVPQSSSAPGDFQYALRRVFKYFLKNKQMYTLLFLDPRNAAAKQLFRGEYIRAFHEFMKGRYAGAPVSDVNLYSRYFIGGLLTVVDYWLERDTDDLSPEQMAVQFDELIPNHREIFSDYVTQQ
ncbi:MAG: TetR/AcrR family transcriptional regulator C-terminal domain-containing protein [Ruminiclostridium sp.]|nr:TetR/AcrR family transcriptional regulator C-terminal domain-containing protein [Ruminiclostridium sp.]